MVECTLSITHCLRLNLQLHTIDLVRTCRISSFCTVAWQLARFQLTRRIARSLDRSAIAELLVHMDYNSNASFMCAFLTTVRDSNYGNYLSSYNTTVHRCDIMIVGVTVADLAAVQCIPLTVTL